MAIGPSLLSTRETPAIAALVLADRVVTLLPEPSGSSGGPTGSGKPGGNERRAAGEESGDSRDSVRAAIDAAPSYLRLMESWRWSAPLWKSGVLGRGCAGVATQDALANVYARIESERALTGLRRWTRHVLELKREGAEVCHPAGPRSSTTDPDSEDFNPTAETSRGQHAPVLQALCADVLKGGPDPGFNIPLAAAMDAFALQHGLLAVRASIDSLTQRAETRLARRVCTIGLPMLTRGSGLAIQRLREALKSELAALRSSIVDAIASDRAANGSRVEDSSLKTAADAYSRAFDAWSRVHVPGDDERGERLTVGYCSFSLVALPPDAALLSAQAAMGAVGPRAATAAVAAQPRTGAPHAADQPQAVRSLYALVVKELNVRPEGPSETRASQVQSTRSVGARS